MDNPLLRGHVIVGTPTVDVPISLQRKLREVIESQQWSCVSLQPSGSNADFKDIIDSADVFVLFIGHCYRTQLYAKTHSDAKWQWRLAGELSKLRIAIALEDDYAISVALRERDNLWGKQQKWRNILKHQGCLRLIDSTDQIVMYITEFLAECERKNLDKLATEASITPAVNNGDLITEISANEETVEKPYEYKPSVSKKTTVVLHSINEAVSSLIPGRLNGKQRRELKAALLSGYYDLLDLTQFTEHYLEINLRQITDTNNLDSAVFMLIKWAQAQGRLHDLLRGLLSDRGSNPDISGFMTANFLSLLQPVIHSSDQAHFRMSNKPKI